MPDLSDDQQLSIQQAIEHGTALMKCHDETCGADGNDHETALGDALADLMHWAASTDVDFDEALRKGRRYFEGECNGED